MHARGICPAFPPGVNFYEVLLPGYHSPLTKTQIGELFQAGRLKRNDPCKPVVQKDWQTIDELFPLLKYRSVGPAPYVLEETTLESASRRMLIFGTLIAGCVAIAFCWYYFFADRTDVISRSARTAPNWPQTIPVTKSQPQVAQQAPVTNNSAPYSVTYVQPATTSQDAPAYVPRNTAAIRERTRPPLLCLGA
jgi:hypothetical protein